MLEACESAIVNGFKGNAGLVCEWYVTPCHCDVVTSAPAPRVCLPEKFTSEALAYEVIAGLKAEPELTKISADVAAAIILSRSYPCTE